MQALILMPFENSFNDVHDIIIKAIEGVRNAMAMSNDHPRKTLLSQIKPFRVDDGFGAVRIMDELLDHLKNSELVIVDITGNNPNVLWELGYAKALDKPIVILNGDENAPFDIASYRYIKYDRSRLSDTLQTVLLDEIIGLFKTTPEISFYPEKDAFARTLALSIPCPVYFLDTSFNIVYMNEAAYAIFLTGERGSGDTYVGKSLNEFINTIAPRLQNLTQIERNLQIQKEHLRSVSDPREAMPINIERVIMKTESFGVLELEKTGIAVRQDGKVIGWVVSFTVVRADNRDGFESFCRLHSEILRYKVLAIPKSPKKTQVLVVDGQTAISWSHSSNSPLQFVWAASYSEKQECFEFMARVMTTDRRRYGLTTVAQLDEYFFEYNRTEYLRVLSSGQLIGVLRLHLNHDFTMHESLYSDLKTCVKDGQGFADAGVYFPEDCPTDKRVEMIGTLLGTAVGHLENIGVTNIYAQVPLRLMARYKSFGFARGGEPFSSKGWSGTWVPVWVKNWDFQHDDGQFAKSFSTHFNASRAMHAINGNDL